jgi:hypothetical protein
MASSESLLPFKLLSLILADPIKATLSSTIINLEWIYIISVTGFGYYECYLNEKNSIYSKGFLIPLLFKTYSIELFPLFIVWYSQYN